MKSILEDTIVNACIDTNTIKKTSLCVGLGNSFESNINALPDVMITEQVGERMCCVVINRHDKTHQCAHIKTQQSDQSFSC